MNRTENDLRVMYAEQPDADQLERRVLDWIAQPRPSRRSTGMSWAAAVAAAGAVAALTVGVVSMVPRGPGDNSPGASGTDAPVASSAPATPLANLTTGLIPADKRQVAGTVTGALLGGGEYSSAADAGHVVVLTFLATWCPPCQAESARLQGLSSGLAGVKFVGVDVEDGSQASTRQWLGVNGISFPVIWDPDGHTLAELGYGFPAVLPVTVMIDKQQRVATVYSGAVTTAELAHALDELAAEPA